jgi:hypothetical protein
MVHLVPSRVNETTTKSEVVVLSPKAENNFIHPERERPNSISVGERGKATMAFSFTDSPPNEYGIISKGYIKGIFS